MERLLKYSCELRIMQNGYVFSRPITLTSASQNELYRFRTGVRIWRAFKVFGVASSYALLDSSFCHCITAVRDCFNSDINFHNYRCSELKSRLQSSDLIDSEQRMTSDE
jgi:hypothetical protein